MEIIKVTICYAQGDKLEEDTVYFEKKGTESEFDDMLFEYCNKWYGDNFRTWNYERNKTRHKQIVTETETVYNEKLGSYVTTYKSYLDHLYEPCRLIQIVDND